MLRYLLPLIVLAPPAVADELTYHNDRFGVTARVPFGMVSTVEPENEDGRTFYDPIDNASVRIWGSYATIGLAAFRARRTEDLESRGAEITYEAGGNSWFVISGYLDDEVFYLRAERGRTCEGEPVWAHIDIRFAEDLRPRFESLVDPLANSLRVAGC